MSIQLTPNALERARRFVSNDPTAIGLRLEVKKSGCSGWGYLVDVAHEARPDDQVFEQDGLALLVDGQTLSLVDGVTIDFVKRGLNQEFVFDNPKATAACGCGESFTTAVGA